MRYTRASFNRFSPTPIAGYCSTPTKRSPRLSFVLPRPHRDLHRMWPSKPPNRLPKTISAHQNFDGLHVWDTKRTAPQDADAHPIEWKSACGLAKTGKMICDV